MPFPLSNLWSNHRRRDRPPPRTRPGQRIYAIGDIHGRADLLAALMALIAADAETSEAQDLVLVFLGDYIDRGRHSRSVIEALSGPPPAGFRAHYLMGNHEDLMLQSIEGIEIIESWLDNGGQPTLESYGCGHIADPQLARRRLLEALPGHHLNFLKSLKSCCQEGDYLFVHAGLRPGVPIEGQSADDMMWIRAPFLKSNQDFGKFVIHGHSIRPEPEVRHNRIGIDTGAWRTGVLTCLVLEGEEKKFLTT